MALIKEKSESRAAKDAVSTIYKKQGGLRGATSIGELSRNRQHSQQD